MERKERDSEEIVRFDLESKNTNQITARQKELMHAYIMEERDNIIEIAKKGDPVVQRIAEILVNNEDPHEIPNQYFEKGLVYGLIKIISSKNQEPMCTNA